MRYIVFIVSIIVTHWSNTAVSQELQAAEIIKSLNLNAHVEGGYFARTFQADHRSFIKTEQGERFTLTSIYYLLTKDSPKGHFHFNKSDIIHYFHSGQAIEYFVIAPSGELKTYVLGPKIDAGQQFQLIVPGGHWKASRLIPDEAYDYGLISEAVAPGFDYKDMTIGKRSELEASFPQHKQLIYELTRN